MRFLVLLGLVVALLQAACGGGADQSPVLTVVPTATQPVVAPATAPATAPAATASTSGAVPATPSTVTTTTGAAVQQLLVGTTDGVMLWTDGVFEPLVQAMPCRVAFQFADGTVVYQESRYRSHDGDAAPVMVLGPGTDPEVLVAADGVEPTLWGVGEIDDSPVVVYERWPDPCGWDESLPACEGRLLALDLTDNTVTDLGAFSAPGYALGPSEVRSGIVLNYNSGAEIGDVGTFLLHDLDGSFLDNPICIHAVDCSQPMRVLGALSQEGTELAYVLDRMEPTTEFEYELVDRSYGVVDVHTGQEIVAVDLVAIGKLAWLDFNGEQGLVSVSEGETIVAYLISEAGGVDPASRGGIATFPER